MTNPKPTCLVGTCNRDKANHGYCAAHWLRIYTTGDVREDVPIRPRRARQAQQCQVKRCRREPIARGYCAGHRHRVVRFGDPLGDIPIGDQAIRKLTRK